MSAPTTTRPAAPATEGATRRRPARRQVLAKAFLLVLVAYFLLPVWWLLVASTKDGPGLFSGSSALWFADGFHLIDNLRSLVTYNSGEYVTWLGNSVLYAVTGGVGATVIAVLAGYGFAKYRFRGRNVMFALLLTSVMVPLTALVIPTFILMSSLELTNTRWAVILPSLLSPFGVYLMRVSASAAVPDELIDAARVDGAGELRIFWQVSLPLMRPAVITVLLLSVVATWNNYFLPLAVLSSSQLFPLTVGLGQWSALAASNNGGGENLWVLIIVGSLVSIVPLVLAFLTLQKYWQGGLAVGSLK